MESTTLLIKQLQSAKLATPSGNTISFQAGDGFRWDPNRLCIFYDPTDNLAKPLLLHELGHALLGHAAYSYDVQLIELERAAWDKALALAKSYGVTIPDAVVEDHLDTYRDWLHARSLCPQCGNTGIQAGGKEYSCMSCHGRWRVNEARTCGLKRYKTK
jgi:hypothetical protein